MIKKFKDLGIDLPDSFSGQKYTTCPQCSVERKKKNVKCLSANGDDKVWHCFHCGFSGSLKTGIDRTTQTRRKKVYRQPIAPKSFKIDDKALKYLEGRGISAKTLEDAKVYTQSAYMPQVEDYVNCICFPYFDIDGNLVNVQYRDGKKNFRMESGAKRIFWGLDGLKED